MHKVPRISNQDIRRLYAMSPAEFQRFVSESDPASLEARLKARRDYIEASRRNATEKAKGGQVARGKGKRTASASATSLGGVGSSGIRSKKKYTSTPLGPELTQEERRKVWQPPARDTSRFKGTHGARHSGTSSYKVPSDYIGTDAIEPMPPRRPSDRDENLAARPDPVRGRTGGSPSASTSAADARTRPRPTTPAEAAGPKREPLTEGEIRRLDDHYRIWGGMRGWRGWSGVIPGKDADFLLSEAKRLNLDRPDDSRWTEGEARVFLEHRRDMPASSRMWRTLLPRKSKRAIELAYTLETRKGGGGSKKVHKKDLKQLASSLCQLTGGDRSSKE